jgi:hypothetical protein
VKAVRQRRPRATDPAYLKWLRAQRCACGCLRGPPSDAAHLRASSPEYDKPLTGMGAKPDDKWALPLNHWCHMRQHAHWGELQWWKERGVADPFALCIEYYQRFKEHG